MTTFTRADLPNVLSWLRIAAGPVVALLVLWGDARAFTDGLAPAGETYFWAFAIFALAALTDLLDGYLARRWSVVSPLGAALDHAADKALCGFTLVALAATVLPPDLVFAAAILVGRDALVGGLREGLAGAGRALPVNRLGKAKTIVELSAIALLILVQGLALTSHWLAALPALSTLAWAATWLAALISLAGAVVYVRAAVGRRADETPSI